MIDYIFDPEEDLSLCYNVLTDSHPAFLKVEVEQWMNNNLPDATYNGIITLSPGNEGLSFSFMSEEDIVAFKLTWS